MAKIDLNLPCDEKMMALLTEEELNQLWVPERYVWLELTDNERKKRKQEWRLISKSLQIFAKTQIRGSGFLKTHRKLFHDGLIDGEFLRSYQGSRPYAGVFTLFYLWYYPNLTHEKCTDILKYFSQPFFICNDAIELFDARDKVFFSLGQGNYGDVNGAYGFMGERMEVIAPHLLGEKGEETCFEKVSINIRRSASGVIRVIASTKSSFTFPNSFFYKAGNYLWPQASYHLVGFIREYFQRQKNLESCPPEKERRYVNDMKAWEIIADLLISSVEAILYLDKHPEVKEVTDLSAKLSRDILAQYEGGEFASEMESLFDLVKNKGIGKVTRDDVLALV